VHYGLRGPPPILRCAAVTATASGPQGRGVWGVVVGVVGAVRVRGPPPPPPLPPTRSGKRGRSGWQRQLGAQWGAGKECEVPLVSRSWGPPPPPSPPQYSTPGPEAQAQRGQHSAQRGAVCAMTGSR
jgi:hypothetical protein